MLSLGHGMYPVEVPLGLFDAFSVGVPLLCNQFCLLNESP